LQHIEEEEKAPVNTPSPWLGIEH